LLEASRLLVAYAYGKARHQTENGDDAEPLVIHISGLKKSQQSH
jgi:hypothetical protein